MPIDDELEQHERLIQLIRDTIQQDSDLREKYQVGDKFRFVRDRLQGLLTHLESQKQKLRETTAQAMEQKEDADKIIVYVYLYNAQGLILRSWSAMLTPKVFYEYSVNRPIYTDKNNLEIAIKLKTNKQQHGYLAVKINRNEIISAPDADHKDAHGYPLIKIKEGSLRFENLVSFYHNDQHYTVTSQGEFVKKE